MTELIEVEVLPKTWTLIKLLAQNPLVHALQNMKGNYLVRLDPTVIERLEQLGADIHNPESIHQALLSEMKDK